MISDRACLVCQSRMLEPLCRMFSNYSRGLSRRVAICRNCGHIQQDPLFSRQDLDMMNRNFLGTKYLAPARTQESGKGEKCQERLSRYIRDGMKVLDVGAGEGWAMAIFKQRNCQYFAIEPIEELAQSIRGRGGEVVGKSILEDYPALNGAFDIILFRHVLEHMLSPGEALIKLRTLLRPPDGILYLAVPNAAKLSEKKGFRTSFLRPVHVSYFCEGNLLRLAGSVGLEPIAVESGNEIFCLLKPGRAKVHNSTNFYSAQKTAFKKAIRLKYGQDMRQLTRILVRRMLDGAKRFGITGVRSEKAT